MTVCTDVAAPPADIGLSVLTIVDRIAWRLGIVPPLIVWAAPETPGERSHVARWGAHDWPHLRMAGAAETDAEGRVWLRIDRLHTVTPADLERLLKEHIAC